MKNLSKRFMFILASIAVTMVGNRCLTSCSNGSGSDSTVKNTESAESTNGIDGTGRRGCGVDPLTGQPHSCWQAPNGAPAQTPAPSPSPVPAPAPAPAPSISDSVGAFGSPSYQTGAFDDRPLTGNCDLFMVDSGMQYDSLGRPIPETQGQREARLRQRSSADFEKLKAQCMKHFGGGGSPGASGGFGGASYN